MTEQLVSALSSILDEREAELDRQEDYYEGELPRVIIADRSNPLYAAILSQSRSPWGELVIDAAAERMRVTGFRIVTPDVEDVTAVEADSAAWDVWQYNQAELYSQVAFTTMLLHGAAYVLVEPGPELPLISFEHPAVMATLPVPGGRGNAAAIKRWSSDQTDVAVLWSLDGEPTTWTRPSGSTKWALADQQLATGASGFVPVYSLLNRPTLTGDYESDLTSLYSTIDRATQSLADRITTQYYASTKVRYLLGVAPEFEEDGITPTQATLKLAVDRLLLIESPDAKAGVFDASDLRQFIEVARSDIAALAAISRLPSFLLSGDLVNVSAEALRSLMQGLTSRVERRQVWASAGLSQAMRQALLLLGDERVSDPRTRVEVIWDDIVEPSVSETASAAATLVQAGILSPTGAQDVVLGYTPSEREKLADYTRADALTQQGVANIATLFAPTATEAALATPAAAAPTEEVEVAIG